MEENIRAMLAGIQRLGDGGPMPYTPAPTADENDSDDAVALSSFSVSSGALSPSSSRRNTTREDEDEEREEDHTEISRKRDVMAQALQTYTTNRDLLVNKQWKTIQCSLSFAGGGVIECAEISAYPCHITRGPPCPTMHNYKVSRCSGVVTGFYATKLADRLRDANHIRRLAWDKQDLEDIAHVEEISCDQTRSISLNIQWSLARTTFFQRPARDRLYFLWTGASMHTSKKNPVDREWKLIWKSIDSNDHPKRPLYGSPYKREVFMHMMILTPLSPSKTEDSLIPEPRTAVTMIGWNADYAGAGIERELSERIRFLQTLDKTAFCQI
jgi:hypothetical protein